MAAGRADARGPMGQPQPMTAAMNNQGHAPGWFGSSHEQAAGPGRVSSGSLMYLGGEEAHSRPPAEATQRVIDTEVSKLLREAEERALAVLGEHRDALDKLAALLVERETVDGTLGYAGHRTVINRLAASGNESPSGDSPSGRSPVSDESTPSAIPAAFTPDQDEGSSDDDSATQPQR